MGRDLKRISMRIDGTCLRNFESTPVCAHLLLGFSAYNRQNLKDKKEDVRSCCLSAINYVVYLF